VKGLERTGLVEEELGKRAGDLLDETGKIRETSANIETGPVVDEKYISGVGGVMIGTPKHYKMGRVGLADGKARLRVDLTNYG